MKIAGIIGGTGPESTVEHYRLIIELYRKRHPDGGYPSLLINSINLKQVTDWVAANQMAELADFLADEIQRLARAGADFGLIAANTPHIVFDEVRSRCSIPLISIVEATRDAVRALGLHNVGLFGTRFTMQGQFYPDVLSRAGITVVIPEEQDQTYIHDKYMNELVNGIILPETRDELLTIVDRFKEQQGIQGIILGGTELSLILGEVEKKGIPLLNTTRIHVERIVEELLS